MADAQDLKSWDPKKSCRFESGHRHQVQKAFIISIFFGIFRIFGTICITVTHNATIYVRDVISASPGVDDGRLLVHGFMNMQTS